MTEKVSDGAVRLEQCRGHLRWRDDATGRVVHVHQLAVIAQGADPARVFSDGDWHVHHGNNVRYDNRPSNLSLVLPDEHGSEANLEGGPWSADWSDLPVAES